LAEASGIRILHIFEDEWLQRGAAVKSLIAQALGVQATRKVFARRCRVSEVSAVVAGEFYETYHIQGATTSSRFLGLYLGEELLAVLGVAFRGTKRGSRAGGFIAEITRYATSCHLLGGFSKLLKAFSVRNPTIKRLVTFSDDRVFTGKMYSTVGFTCVAKLRPDYFYVKNGRRVHKSNLQKSRVRSSGLLYDATMTEFQLAEMNGYHRVYDCGKTRWEMQI
jgi:hypothetical protein